MHIKSCSFDFIRKTWYLWIFLVWLYLNLPVFINYGFDVYVGDHRRTSIRKDQYWKAIKYTCASWTANLGEERC
uniref:Uncharacterized protein n=1 Tax=Arundo donax TaxID=35708 RepID=A0A0A8YB41_ARUDO